MALSVALVHARQFSGEQCGFFATGTGLDLHDDVLAIVGITGCQQISQLLFQLRDFRLQTLGLFREFGILAGHFQGGLAVILGLGQALMGLDDGLQLREALAHFAGGSGVIVQLGVTQLHFQALVLRQDVIDH